MLGHTEILWTLVTNKNQVINPQHNKKPTSIFSSGNLAHHRSKRGERVKELVKTDSLKDWQFGLCSLKQVHFGAFFTSTNFKNTRKKGGKKKGGRRKKIKKNEKIEGEVRERKREGEKERREGDGRGGERRGKRIATVSSKVSLRLLFSIICAASLWL